MQSMALEPAYSSWMIGALGALSPSRDALVVLKVMPLYTVLIWTSIVTDVCLGCSAPLAASCFGSTRNWASSTTGTVRQEPGHEGPSVPDRQNMTKKLR